WMGLGPYMGTITPPAGTEGGTYRMRVRIQDGYYDPVVDPCGVSTYGEVEDYCVYVCGLEPPIIEVPTGGPGPAYHFAETVNTCGYCAYVPTGHMGEFGDGCWYYYIYMGPSVLYMLHTYEVGTITVTTTGDDPAMFIFTDLCDPFNTCVAGSDWTGGNPSTETCVLTDLAPGVYYINVALWDDGSGRCGDIDLDITGDVQLPVELTSFEAIAGNNEVALTWTTAAELNNDYFEVQRSTNSEWTTLGTVDGTNDANGSSYNYTDRSVVNGVTYTYRLLSHDINGAVNEYEMTAEATPQAPLPTEYALGQNYPNPFNPTTTITYALKDAGFVTLKVYNLLGQEVANLVSEQLNPGSYTANFNATNLPSGIYVYRLEVNDFTAQQKMVLLK
ncbi:T9SS type A sorting domain-containing protein, partial [bacterium]|nr:T9SS type A sorting domain-containing protein [bacterium]